MGSTTVADRRFPAHVAILVGASTAIYAISLAGVTALQSNTDQALILARTPGVEAVARIGDGHDRVQVEIARSTGAYADSAARFDDLAAGLSTLDATLDSYAGRTAVVSGAARALPARVSLPTVSRTVTSTSAKPRVKAATGASGG